MAGGSVVGGPVEPGPPVAAGHGGGGGGGSDEPPRELGSTGADVGGVGGACVGGSVGSHGWFCMRAANRAQLWEDRSVGCESPVNTTHS